MNRPIEIIKWVFSTLVVVILVTTIWAAAQISPDTVALEEKKPLANCVEIRVSKNHNVYRFVCRHGGRTHTFYYAYNGRITLITK